MKEKLEEIIAKAVVDPASYRDLALVYQRGHDLSGIIRFEMQGGGAFALSSSNPRCARTLSLEGELDADKRNAVLTAIEDAGLLHVPSSTRNIADDELPIVVELSYDDLRHRLLIWAGDALEHAEFHRFETTLWALLRGLCESELRSAPFARAPGA